MPSELHDRCGHREFERVMEVGPALARTGGGGGRACDGGGGDAVEWHVASVEIERLPRAVGCDVSLFLDEGVLRERVGACPHERGLCLNERFERAGCPTPRKRGARRERCLKHSFERVIIHCLGKEVGTEHIEGGGCNNGCEGTCLSPADRLPCCRIAPLQRSQNLHLPLTGRLLAKLSTAPCF